MDHTLRMARSLYGLYHLRQSYGSLSQFLCEMSSCLICFVEDLEGSHGGREEAWGKLNRKILRLKNALYSALSYSPDQKPKLQEIE